jgi:P27 family predicted phage terminase small subunit
MARGPKPEPAEVKKQKGNPSRRRIGADPVAPELSTAGLKPPEWLTGEGRKTWDRLAPRLVLLKLLTPVDAEAFGRYCRNLARWLKMQRVLDREGETYETESAHGSMKRGHPAFLISDRLERQLLAAEDRFGLNPAERQRLFAARSVTPDPANDLFGKRPPAPAGELQLPLKPTGPIGLLN